MSTSSRRSILGGSAALLSLLLASVASVAAAGTITLTVSATLSPSSGDLNGNLTPGASVTGTIELDDTVVGVFTPSGNPTFVRSEMLYAGAIVSSSLVIDGNPVSGSGGDIRILDAATGQLAGEDNYEINAVLDTGTVGTAAPVSIQIIPEYGDSALSLSGSDPLFAPPPFDAGRFNPVTLTSDTGGTAFGQMDGLSSSGGSGTPTVPTSSGWLLLLLTTALAGVATLRLGARGALRA
jgi:hypothetical protein